MSAEELATRVAQLEAALLQTRAAVENATARAVAAETAASHAAQQPDGVDSPSRRTALVDTRVLGRPRGFDGKEAHWKGFRFTFLGYCGAIDPSLRELLVQAEIEPDTGVLLNAALAADVRQKSAQIYYMLVMLLEEPAQRMLEHAGESEGLAAWRRLADEFEPKTAGRHAGMLLNLLRYEFSGEPRAALDEFEVLVRNYEKSSGELVSEPLKVALVQKGLRDEGLRQHLVLHAARLPSYSAVRDEVRSILVTRAALQQQPAAMEIGAVAPAVGGKGVGGKSSGGKSGATGRGKGGDSKGGKTGKGKDKDSGKKDDREITCFFCGKKGHRKADCRSFAAKRSSTTTGSSPSAAGGGTVGGKGSSKQVGAITASPLGPAGGDSTASGDDRWIFEVGLAAASPEERSTHLRGGCGVLAGSGVIGGRPTAAGFRGQRVGKRDAVPERRGPEAACFMEPRGGQLSMDLCVLARPLGESVGHEPSDLICSALGPATRVMIDSGCGRSACPHWFGEAVGDLPLRSGRAPLQTATGEPLHVQGRRVLLLTARGGETLTVEFEVAPVIAPIVSVSALTSAGYSVVYGARGSFIKGGVLDKEAGQELALYSLRWAFWADFVATAPSSDAGSVVICPVAPARAPEGAPTAESDEGLPARAPPVPRAPSEEEARRHALTHWPYRSWCEACVRARGKDQPHRRVDRIGDETATVQMDYLFLSAARGAETQPVLVLEDTRSGALATIAVEAKGLASYPVEAVTHVLSAWGLTRANLQPDNEAAILALARAVQLRLSAGGVEVTLRPGPAHSSATAGAAERANQECEGLVRTFCLDLERKLSLKIVAGAALLTWIVRHTGWVYTRFAPQVDGRTPYKRLFGREFGGLLAEMGESVLALHPERDAKMEERWVSGTWLGKTEMGDSHLVAHSGRVNKHRTVKRKTEQRRWNKDEAEQVQIWELTPWHPRADQEIVPAAPRRRYITQSLLERLGRTPGCKGCENLGASHNEACRARIEEALSREAAAQVGAPGPSMAGGGAAAAPSKAEAAAAGGPQSGGAAPSSATQAAGGTPDPPDSGGARGSADVAMDPAGLDSGRAAPVAEETRPQTRRRTEAPPPRAIEEEPSSPKRAAEEDTALEEEGPESKRVRMIAGLAVCAAAAVDEKSGAQDRDEVTGELLDPTLVREGKAREIKTSPTLAFGRTCPRRPPTGTPTPFTSRRVGCCVVRTRGSARDWSHSSSTLACGTTRLQRHRA